MTAPMTHPEKPERDDFLENRQSPEPGCHRAGNAPKVLGEIGIGTEWHQLSGTAAFLAATGGSVKMHWARSVSPVGDLAAAGRYRIRRQPLHVFRY